jgi:FtsP/CotA-like multicopper oxidase with cupredoxin domain
MMHREDVVTVENIKLRFDEKESPQERGTQAVAKCRGRISALWSLAATAVAVTATLSYALQAQAQAQAQAQPTAAPSQFIPCANINQPLVQIPELVSEGGKLRQTIVLADVTQRTNLKPDPKNPNNCVPQFVRNFVGEKAVAPYYRGAAPRSGYVPPWNPNLFFADPVPGPTLRARVGDLVELTFVNQVDRSHYGDTIDTGDTVGACDESSSPVPGGQGYPAKAHEVFPDCFHGSSSANIHFHGTHTSPSSTADNVFLNIAPSPRAQGSREPAVTTQLAAQWFEQFFSECESHLNNNVLSQWPFLWPDLPQNYRDQQETLLKAYDANRPDPQKLWPVDQYQIDTRQWPQYYIGAYPYCFRLPGYTGGSWPPARLPVHPGMSPRDTIPLQMGQAPGTHWYHAHKHGSTTLNVLNGMTGAFIIEGTYDDELNRFYGTIVAPTTPPKEVPWTRGQPVLVINELGVSPALYGGGIGGGGPPFSVNGRLQPVVSMKPNEVQLWRIVNTSSRTFANIVGPPAGFAWRQLAQDGVQFSQANYDQSAKATSFLLAPGNRVDLLVQAPAAVSANPVPVMVQRTVTRTGLSSVKQVPLMSIQVTGEPPTNINQTEFITKAPTPPAFLADIKDQEIKGTKTITFNSGPSLSSAQHTVDGHQFDGSTGATVLLGRAEEWKIVNTTVGDSIGPGPIDHPFHIHINPFQIVEVFDPNESLTDPATGRPILDSDSGTPLKDARTGQALIDEQTGKPMMDPKTLKPYPKYVFDQAAKKQTGQCYIDARGNPADWKTCENPLGSQPNRIWWDTFPIPSGKIATDAKGNVIKGPDGQPIVVPGYFRMRSRFVDYPGLYVLHCHILAHEDRGMMTVVEVRPLYPPVQHH